MVKTESAPHEISVPLEVNTCPLVPTASLVCEVVYTSKSPLSVRLPPPPVVNATPLSQKDEADIGSDERAKTDLVVISDAIDKVNTLRAVNYKWKYGNEKRRTRSNVGLIAQDVYKVLPEACIIPEREYEVIDHPIYEGEKQAQGMWTYADSKVVPLLVKAIQELSAKVEALENA